MPEYLAPGVYVEEVTFRSRRIEGVPTGTAGLLGVTERGPMQPVAVHGFADFERWFGRQRAGGHVVDAVRGFFDNGGRTLVVCRVTGRAALGASAPFGGWCVQALGPGSWGDRVWARLDREPDGSLRLRLAYWEAMPPGGPFDSFVDDGATQARLGASPPAVLEDFRGVWPGDAAGTASTLVTVQATPGVEPLPGSAALTGGHDAAADVADYEGQPQAAPGAAPQGLAALDDSALGRDVSLLAAPGAPPDVARALVAHCERVRHRMAVLDLPPDAAGLQADARALFGDTRFAAAYAPWLRVAEPAGAAPVAVPPSGHVLGCFARTAVERGVWKAPANEPLQGLVGLAAETGAAQADALLARGVNPIRRLPGRGVRLMGARTVSSDPEFRHVAVRRLLGYLEHSLEQGLQDVVFEPQGEPLWAQVRGRVEAFLFEHWRSGAFVGQTAREAYFVRCDRSTMTQADVDQGRLIVLVGVAPVKPAEFVIFRLGQRTGQVGG